MPALIWLLLSSVIAYLIGKIILHYSSSFLLYWVYPKLGWVVDLEPYKNLWTVVTGCTDGVGRAYIEELAKKGFSKFALIGRDQKKLEKISDFLCSKYDAEVRICKFDFTDSDYASVVEFLRGFQDIGVLVNNVGATPSQSSKAMEQPEGVVETFFRVNAFSVVKHNSDVNLSFPYSTAWAETWQNGTPQCFCRDLSAKIPVTKTNKVSADAVAQPAAKPRVPQSKKLSRKTVSGHSKRDIVSDFQSLQHDLKTRLPHEKKLGAALEFLDTYAPQIQAYLQKITQKTEAVTYSGEPQDDYVLGMLPKPFQNRFAAVATPIDGDCWLHMISQNITGSTALSHKLRLVGALYLRQNTEVLSEIPMFDWERQLVEMCTEGQDGSHFSLYILSRALERPIYIYGTFFNYSTEFRHLLSAQTFHELYERWDEAGGVSLPGQYRISHPDYEKKSPILGFFHLQHYTAILPLCPQATPLVPKNSVFNLCYCHSM